MLLRRLNHGCLLRVHLWLRDVTERAVLGGVAKGMRSVLQLPSARLTVLCSAAQAGLQQLQRALHGGIMRDAAGLQLVGPRARRRHSLS